MSREESYLFQADHLTYFSLQTARVTILQLPRILISPRLHKANYNILLFPSSIFAYKKGAGTGDNIITLNSLDGHGSSVVFLALEKAFELANKDAILA